MEEGMSLDVYLNVTLPEKVAERDEFLVASDLCEEKGFLQAAVALRGIASDINTTDCVYEANITHNLGRMAEAAGVYPALWRPEEIGVTKASQLVGPLEAGLSGLQARPDHFRTFNPSNGWGSYESLVRFVERYLAACEANPDAAVEASR
jgi:hypothetical protein